MIRSHFEKEISRLIECFGKAQFPPPRVQIIWQEVQYLSASWFTKQCDYFIRKMIRPDFDEAIALEREQQWKYQKETQSEQAEEFMSSYSGADIQTICHQIRQHIQGSTHPIEFESMIKVLTPQEQFKCARCLDTKVYVDAHGYLTLCPHGPKNP